MRIGIITFHKAENFGSALQAYALSMYLKKIGHEVKIIDFEYNFDLRQYNLFRKHLYLKRPQAFAADLLYIRKNRKRKNAFKKFRADFLMLTESTYSYQASNLNELNNDFDCFVCGSDQIWNLNCTEVLVPEYFLSFADTGKLKVSFAPSMPTKVQEKFYSELRPLINRLDFVSVREAQTVEYLKKEVGLIDKQIEHFVDPTLLLDDHDYISGFNLKREDRHIFVYLLGKEHISSVIEEANNLQKKTGLPIKYVFMRKITNLNNSEYLFGVGPIEFLNLIYNAEYVLTDSFHATVFSNIFEIKYCAFPREGSSSRMTELVDSLGMNYRFYGNDKVWFLKNMDGAAIHKEISKLAVNTKDTFDKWISNYPKEMEN